MKLNNKKKITLCQKALSTKELEHYARLCTIYNKLAKTQSSDISPIRIEQRYSTALTNATNGNLDFLEDPDCIFTYKEAELLHDYALHASKLQEFKTASGLLKNVLPTPKSEIDYDALDEYFDYMENTSKSTQIFDDDIAKHSPTFLGHEFFAKSKKAIRAIQKIDKGHLPNIVEKVTPELYGANISGYRRTLRSIVKDANNIFSQKEQETYGKPLSNTRLAMEGAQIISQNVADIAIDTADNVRTVLHDHGRQIAAITASALLLTGGYSSITWAADKIAQKDQSVTYNLENGYKMPFSDKLVQNIIQLNQDIDEISSYNITSLSAEQAEKLSTVRDREDIIISDYMYEIGQKYCEQMGYEFVDATNYYDKNSKELPYYLSLTYIDKDGNEVSKNLSNFGINISQTGEWEKTLDDSPSIEDLGKIANGINNLAGKDVKYSKILGMHTVATEKDDTLNKTNLINDDLTADIDDER